MKINMVVAAIMVAALAVADRYGVDLGKAAQSLGTFTGFKGRLERIEKDGILYSHQLTEVIQLRSIVSFVNHVRISRHYFLGDDLKLC